MSRRALSLLAGSSMLMSVGLTAVTVSPAAAALTPNPSCTRYVATTGSDSYAGSAAAPWRTLKASLPKLRAGDTLCVAAGTYTEEVTVTPADGTPTSRITVRPYNTERPVIDGRFSLTDPDYWTIHGLRFTNPTPVSSSLTDKRIVSILAGTGWILDANEIFNGTYAGLLVGKSTTYGAPKDNIIRRNFIHDTSAVNLYYNPGREATGGLIEHNIFVRAGTENVKLGWGGSDVCSGSNLSDFGIGQVMMRYNTLAKSGHYGLIIAEPGGLGRVDVQRNIITQAPKANVRYDSVEGCLGGQVWVQANLGGPAPKFSEDFGDSPVNKSHEAANVFPVDPVFDSSVRPTNPAALAYGHAAL